MTSKRSLLRKTLLWLAVGATALVAGAALWLAFLFDANTLKPRLVAFVAQQYGRTLDMRGDLALSFFPGTGIVARQVTLSERDGTAPFVRSERVRASVALLPLLADRLLIQGIEIDDARVVIEKRADGTWNFDDLIPRGPSRFREFLIGSLRLRNAEVRLRAAPGQTALELASLDLSVAPLAPARPAKFAAAGKWKIDGASATGTLDLNGTMTLQDQDDALALRDVSAKWTAQWDAGSAIDLDMRLAGLSLARQRAAGFTAAIAFTSSGKRMATAQLKSDAIPFALDSVPFALDWRMESGGWAGRLGGMAGKGSDAAWRIDALQAVAANPDIPAKIEMNGNVAIDAAARRADIAGATLVATLQGNPGGPHTASGDIQASFDMHDELRAEASFAGTLDRSRLAASARYPAAAPGVVGFAASLDALDLDAWTSNTPSTSRDAFYPDLAPLRALPLRGSLAIGTLKSGAVTARKVRIDVE